MKNNFFDDIDNDWSDLISDVYSKYNNKFILEVIYDRLIECFLYDDLSEIAIFNKVKFEFRKINKINIKKQGDVVTVIITTNDIKYEYFKDDNKSAEVNLKDVHNDITFSFSFVIVDGDDLYLTFKDLNNKYFKIAYKFFNDKMFSSDEYSVSVDLMNEILKHIDNYNTVYRIRSVID